MMDVFRLRTSTINIASFRPFKFGNSKNCQLGCLKNEDLEHLVSCDVFKIEEDLMIQNEEFKDFFSSSCFNFKENINKINKIITLRSDLVNLKAKENLENSICLNINNEKMNHEHVKQFKNTHFKEKGIKRKHEGQIEA